MATIPECVHAAARQFGPDDAIVDRGRRTSFAELERLVDEAARGLIACGVQPGDRVGLWAPNSPRWIVASFAIYAAGAVLVPLNTRYRGPEAVHVLRTAGVRVLLTVTDFEGGDYLGMLAASGDAPDLMTIVLSGPVPPGGRGWDELLTAGQAVDVADVRAREAALGDEYPSDIIFTSGTTGAPKGAVLTHGASVRTYREWSDLVGLRHGDRYLVVYPFFHTAGLKSAVLACVLRGASIHPEAVFNVPTVMARVASERITMLPGPPTVFQSILGHADLAAFDLSSLRLSVTGAAVVPVSVVVAMRARLGFETVVTGYGLTETTGTVSMCRHDDPPDVIAHTVGRPLRGVEIRIDDGEILVRGFNVMQGYFNNPEATREAIDPEGWLRTGDIGFIDEGGNLHITDRKKDMFIVGGFNAYPAEIEATLLNHPAVAQVAVVGMPDARLGEVGAAFVVPGAGQTIDVGELIAWCRERMANFKVPRRVETVEALPLTPSGKVMKFRLRELL